jgi:hypothetical protein
MASSTGSKATSKKVKPVSKKPSPNKTAIQPLSTDSRTGR